MKMKNTSILVLSLLLGLSALHAVPADPSNPPSDNSNSTDSTVNEGALTLTINDAKTPQTITVDATAPEKSQLVTFSLPIVDIGGTWSYMISNEAADPSLPSFLIPVQVNADNVTFGGVNKFTKEIEWNHSFELTCMPSDVGSTEVTFFYIDSSHQISNTYSFTINSVAAASK